MKIAIYSRKSKFTGKGESIENQILKCQQFIKFKFENVNEDDAEIFIDEGFSGKNEDRPRYQDMLSKIKSKQIDKIVIYQLNRLGRNARDIHNTMQMCDDLDVIIYSATEGFDSSTSFGRALIGILASLAQLEREQLAERVKDNMYTLAKMGRWLGGKASLGFDGTKESYIDECGKQRYITKLIANKEEQTIVKNIYKKYLQLKSLSQVEKWILTNNIRGKNGGNIDKTRIDSMLRNPVYVKSNENIMQFLEHEGFEVCGVANGNGFLKYGTNERKIVAVSNHKGIIEADVWLEIQHILDSNRDKAPRLGKTNTALLTGILRCKCGSIMRVSYGHKSKNKPAPFYYSCAMKINSGGTRCNAKNINGLLIENKLIEYIKNYNKDKLIVELKNTIEKSNTIDLENKSEYYAAEIEKSNKAINKLFMKLKLIDDEELSKMILDEIQKENKKIKKMSLEKDKLENDAVNISSSIANVQNTILKLEEFQDTFDGLDYESKKKILNELISSITIIDDDTLSIEFNIKKN